MESTLRVPLERGEFDSWPGKGKRIGLTADLDTPGPLRATEAILQRAGFAARETELDEEIRTLDQQRADTPSGENSIDLGRKIRNLQMRGNLHLEIRCCAQSSGYHRQPKARNNGVMLTDL